jgi:CubicO group peptidase (beta-lactamase class C family)
MYWSSQGVGGFVYSNPGFSMLGELVRVQSGMGYEDYVKSQILVDTLNMDDKVFADPGHRNTVDESLVSGSIPLGRFEPLQSHLRKYLINTSHPYVCAATVTPCILQPIKVDSSPSPAKWSFSTASAMNSAPNYSARYRYAGKAFMGGALLAAGGWHSDGKTLGELIRVLVRSSIVMPNAVTAQLWSPQWWQLQATVPQIPAKNWAYGLGWYVRGNWVAWAGGTHGASTIVLHNTVYDFTAVLMSNVIGNGFTDLNTLLTPACLADNQNTVVDECPAAIIY